jgi:hypothetical protein
MRIKDVKTRQNVNIIISKRTEKKSSITNCFRFPGHIHVRVPKKKSAHVIFVLSGAL